MAVRRADVLIGGNGFNIDTSVRPAFRRVHESLMVPRTEISGEPGAINLASDEWRWTMSDFSGGEGRLVFDESDPFGPPAFHSTDGAIDARTRGEFKMSPVSSVVTAAGGGTTTTVQGNSLVTDSGSPSIGGETPVLGATGSGSATGTSVSATWSAATLTGSLLVAKAMYDGGSGTTVTLAGWTLAATSNNGTGVGTKIFYKENAASESGTVTVTLSPSTGASLQIEEWKNIATSSSLDKTASNSGTSTSPDSGTTAATTQATEVAVAVLATDTGAASSSGPLSPGTVANDSSFGDTAWSNPSNATASDDSRATVVLTAILVSQYLKATNFGFAIPTGATINGIVAEVEGSASAAGDITDERIRIVKGGTIGSTDKSVGGGWDTSDVYRTYGSASDLWGETWTAADINASTFGIAVAADSVSGATARIDHIRITVHYTPQGATLSAPTNSFTLQSGLDWGAGLYKTLSATGTQNAGATASNSVAWAGAIATFKSTTTTNAVLDAVEGVRTNHTPGAVAVTVTARFLGYLSSGDTATLKLRIRNNTDATDVSNTTLAISGVESGASHDLQLTFTGTAAKEYYYIAELSAASGLDGTTDKVEVDYVSYMTGATAPTDVRALQLGYNEEVKLRYWDGTNTDAYIWDFANNEWDLEQNNAVASQIVAMAASDLYQYDLAANGQVYRSTTGAFTAYTAAATGTPAGLAISTDRLYVLTFGATRYLYEIYLDQTAGLPLVEGATAYQRMMTNANFPDEESHDTTLRQYLCPVPAGVQFICNAAGGTTQLYEYSPESFGRPVATLGKGYRAHSIFNYGGLTYIGVQFANRASAPAESRSGVYTYSPSTGLRFLAFFRFQDPDDERVSYIDAWGDSVYFLQGKYLWRYDAAVGGITLDTLFGPATDTNARSFAVMDTKKWAAYAGEGPHVTGNTYPVNQTTYLRSPIWNYGVPDKDKVLLDITVVTKPLSANTSVSVQYQKNESGSWVTLSAPASASTAGSTTHTFKAWGSAETPATVNFRNLEWRVGLKSTDGVDTPVVRSVTARTYVLEYQQAFEIAIRLDDDTATSRPAADQFSGRDRAEFLWTLVSNKAIVSFVNNYESPERTPDPETYAVIVEDPHMDLRDKAKGTARLRLKVVA